jgi:hypothetical protein
MMQQINESTINRPGKEKVRLKVNTNDGHGRRAAARLP